MGRKPKLYCVAISVGSSRYTIDRQTGSHLRLTTQENGEHHITVPNHSPIKLGTLNAIVKEIAEHFDIERDELLSRLFSK